jgi:hypothetical protein
VEYGSHIHKNHLPISNQNSLSWREFIFENYNSHVLFLAGALTPIIIVGNIYISCHVSNKALICFILPPQTCVAFMSKNLDNGNFFTSIKNNKKKALLMYSLGVSYTLIGATACLTGLTACFFGLITNCVKL